MRSRKIGFRLLFGLPALLAALIIPTLAAGALRIGDTAPLFTLRDLQGKQVQLAAEIKGHRVTLVNFWATWCPPCRREIPELIAVYKSYRARGLQVVAVDLCEAFHEVRAFASRQGMTFPVLIDPDGRVAEKYGVHYIPLTYLLDATGRIRARIDGGTTASDLRARIEPFLKGE